MSEWCATLPGMLGRAWEMLGDGAARRNIAANRPVMATVAADGTPEARTLVLRGADRQGGVLTFFTDAGSAKLDAIAAHPVAALHVWDAAAMVQVRIGAAVRQLSGPDADAVWASMRPEAFLNYGSVPPPGTPIPDALAYQRATDVAVARAAFVVLEAQVRTLEVLHLGAVHRRARFAEADGWAGEWLSP